MDSSNIESFGENIDLSPEERAKKLRKEYNVSEKDVVEKPDFEPNELLHFGDETINKMEAEANELNLDINPEEIESVVKEIDATEEQVERAMEETGFPEKIKTNMEKIISLLDKSRYGVKDILEQVKRGEQEEPLKKAA